MQLSSILEALGAACLVVAAGAWDWRAALAVIGALLIVVSYVLGAAESEPEAFQ